MVPADMMMAAPMAPVVPTSIPQGMAYPQTVDPNMPLSMAPMPQGVAEGYMTTPVQQQVSVESEPINLVLRVR